MRVRRSVAATIVSPQFAVKDLRKFIAWSAESFYHCFKKDVKIFVTDKVVATYFHMYKRTFV